MKIAIVGPGNVGLGLARLLAAKNYEVVLAHKDLTVATRLAADIGSSSEAADIADIAKLAHIVILAVPYGAAEAAIAALGDLSGKTLIDVTNPLTPDYLGLTIGHTTSAAEEIAKLAPGAHVVKAFNTIFWQALPFELRRGKPALQVLLAGDNAAAKEKVAAMVTDLEFEAVDAGSLTNARYIEPVAELNIHFGYALGWGTKIAPAWVRI